MVNGRNILNGLKVSGRDLRTFVATTAVLTALFSAGVTLDSHYNGGKFGSAIAHHGRIVASIDNSALCSPVKFER